MYNFFFFFYFFSRVCDVVGRGFSGYTSRACRIILPRLFSTENISKIKAFVICIGANDSNDAKSKTNQHVPLDEYCKNLENMIQYLLVIIIVTTLTIFQSDVSLLSFLLIKISLIFIFILSIFSTYYIALA